MVRKLKPITAVLLLTGFLLSPCAHAWNNDYSSSKPYDSYSQSWQSYKQQNNINTQPVYQQSWWDKTISSIGNFFSGVTQAVTNFVTNIGNFFTSVYNNVHDFFFKTPEIKANSAAAPPVKDTGVINHASTLDTKQNLSTKISDTAKADTYKTQTTQKNNPYAYLTAEKACYDPRAIGLSQFSSKYQAIEAEYAARDKWQAAAQQSQIINDKLQIVEPEGSVGAGHASPVIETDNTNISQKGIAVIAPARIQKPDPSVMPAENWQTAKNTQIVQNILQQQQPKQQNEFKTTLTDAAQFYGDKAKTLGNNLQQFGNYLHNDWKPDSSAEATLGGFVQGLGREIKIEDLYTPVQKFFQNKSDQITNVTIAAMRGLDIANANIGDEKGFLQTTNRIGIGAMKGCVVAGAVVAQTVADVGKFGSEIPQIMANAVLAKDAFASGDLKQAWRYVGNAIGGVGREAGRAFAVGSIIKSVQTAFTAPGGVDKALTFLEQNGVSPLRQKEIINSFQKNTITVRVAGPNEYGIRYFDGVGSFGKGSYLFDTFPASRQSLAISSDWNQMTQFKQWQIKPNTVIIEGKTAAQGPWLPGGQTQKFILNKDDLLEVTR